MTHHSKQVTQGSHRAQEQLFDARTSARQKYARLVVGRQGWGALIKHELIVQLSQAWPGAVGLVLRKFLYPKLLGACGRNVVFGQNVVLSGGGSQISGLISMMTQHITHDISLGVPQINSKLATPTYETALGTVLYAAYRKRHTDT